MTGFEGKNISRKFTGKYPHSLDTSKYTTRALVTMQKTDKAFPQQQWVPMYNVHVLAVRCFSKYSSANILQQIFFSKYSSTNILQHILVNFFPSCFWLLLHPSTTAVCTGQNQFLIAHCIKLHHQLFCDLPNCLQIFLTYYRHFFDVHKQDEFANLPTAGFLYQHVPNFLVNKSLPIRPTVKL